MGRKPTNQEHEAFIKYLRDARDEMNLLEHSISSASTQVDRKTRSIVFQKTEIDPETKEPVERHWEVKFRDGRPTAIDDDVFVALLKLSADLGFSVKRVEFTRWELCRILGWADNGQNYKKIDEALTRLRGVSIDAKNYWYDNKLKCWRDRDFNILDVSDVLSRTTYQKALKAGGKEAAKSWIEWSETMMDSFAAGYIRRLDLYEYLSIENPVARKLYRFLGKQFWHRTRYAIDLETLMHEKLGYDENERRLWRLKQKLAPVVEELEAKSLYGLTHEFNASYGKCEVVFNAAKTTKDQGKSGGKKGAPENPLLDRLVTFGLDKITAVDALKRLSTERILTDLEHVEHERKAKRVRTSPAGMLAQMLKSDEPWGRPQGFVSSYEREAAKKRVAAREEQERKVKAAAEARACEARAQEVVAFNEFMAALSAAERSEFTKQALQDSFWGRRYRTMKAEGAEDKAAEALQQALEHLWKETGKGRPAPASRRGTVQKSIQF